MAQIQCRYCGLVNDAQERRCVRCMRRLHLASPRPAPETYPIAGATAPVLQTIAGAGAAAAAAPAREKEPAGLQQPLFLDAPPASKVIPIPTLTPLRRTARESSPVRRVAPRTGAPPARRGPELQRALDFQAASAAPAPHADGIYCDAPVALPTHRIMAAAVDISVVLIALGIFGVILFFCGGDISVTRHTTPYFLAVISLTSLFYRLLWTLGNGDSPGMRFAGLRLVDFDGRKPTREQRLRRQLVSLLSVISAGLGLAWALVDEENLTWHDHISKTFPTPGA
ncbi:MAG: RDD family protein [Bryobacterales bacterium]|nr:RDD family protein [Bryobacterales bacterium]